MASNFSFLLLFLFIFLFPSVLSPFAIAGAVEEKGHNSLGLAIMISRALSNKGYTAMSQILEESLPTMIPSKPSHHNTTTLTIFCPTDTAFFSPKYPQPPFTLLQYHIVPARLDKEALESSLPFESKLDTLLTGHPLVITKLPRTQSASINEVKITDWEIYNDCHVLVHGIEDFFDPALQIIRYPWYDDDGGVAKNVGKIRTTIRDSEEDAVKRSISEKMFMIFKGFVFLASAYFLYYLSLRVLYVVLDAFTGIRPRLLGLFHSGW